MCLRKVGAELESLEVGDDGGVVAAHIFEGDPEVVVRLRGAQRVERYRRAEGGRSRRSVARLEQLDTEVVGGDCIGG